MCSFLSNKAAAAHLALAAVAPLVLCKYFADGSVCETVLWLVALAAVWAFMAPGKRDGERAPDARKRSMVAAAADPFVWFSLLLVAYAAVSALNTGVGMAYDAEKSSWSLAAPALPWLPGGVAGAGTLGFAAMVAVFVVYLAVACFQDDRQGGSFVAFALFALVVDAGFSIAVGRGIDGGSSASYGIWALCAAAAMFSAERRGDRPHEMLVSLLLAGCLSALVLSGRPEVICVFVAALFLFAIAFAAIAFRDLRIMGVARAFVMLAVALAMSAAVYEWYSGDWAALLPVWVRDSDPVLTRIAVKTWEAKPWTGAGDGAFPLVVRFGATAADWSTLGPLPDLSGNGWRTLLVERGMIGIIAVAVSFGAMLFAWVRGFRVTSGLSSVLPLLPIGIAAVSAALVFDDSALRAHAMVAFASLAALSVNGGS